MFALGDALDDYVYSTPGPDPLQQALHASAVALGNQRAYVNSLVADPNTTPDQLTTEVDYLGSCLSDYIAARAAWVAQNPYTLGTVDNVILSVGNWAQGFLDALPNTMAAIPNALIDAINKIIANALGHLKEDATSAATGLIVPAAIVLGILFFAEKSRTYQRKVA